MAKRFFFVSAGVLCLMVSALIGFHLGNRSAQAQAPEAISGYRTAEVSTVSHFVLTSNGDLYVRRTAGNSWLDGVPTLLGNYYNFPVPTAQSTWGAVKDEFEKKKD